MLRRMLFGSFLPVALGLLLSLGGSQVEAAKKKSNLKAELQRLDKLLDQILSAKKSSQKKKHHKKHHHKKHHHKKKTSAAKSKVRTALLERPQLGSNSFAVISAASSTVSANRLMLA